MLQPIVSGVALRLGFLHLPHVFHIALIACNADDYVLVGILLELGSPLLDLSDATVLPYQTTQPK
jgi:hypothetical protein